MSDRDMVDNFINKRESEMENLTLDFAKQMLALELQIKDVKTDMKAIKEEAKNSGVSVQKVQKALKKIKDSMKVSDMDNKETEFLYEVLETNVDIKAMVENLLRKD